VTKTCSCNGRARCPFCKLEVREERGVWTWNRERASRRSVIGIFTGRVSLDGAAVIPFSGPGPVSLPEPQEPGAEVSYALVRTDDGLVAERVRVAA
jgi:hypothetical protein